MKLKRPPHPQGILKVEFLHFKTPPCALIVFSYLVYKKSVFITNQLLLQMHEIRCICKTAITGPTKNVLQDARCNQVSVDRNSILRHPIRKHGQRALLCNRSLSYIYLHIICINCRAHYHYFEVSHMFFFFKNLATPKQSSKKRNAFQRSDTAIPQKQ